MRRRKIRISRTIGSKKKYYTLEQALDEITADEIKKLGLS